MTSNVSNIKGGNEPWKERYQHEWLDSRYWCQAMLCLRWTEPAKEKHQIIDLTAISTCRPHFTVNWYFSDRIQCNSFHFESEEKSQKCQKWLLCSGDAQGHQVSKYQNYKGPNCSQGHQVSNCQNYEGPYGDEVAKMKKSGSSSIISNLSRTQSAHLSWITYKHEWWCDAIIQFVHYMLKNLIWNTITLV